MVRPTLSFYISDEHEEHTRKLRAELPAEEHRHLELNQILNDMIPEPEMPHAQSPRLVKNVYLVFLTQIVLTAPLTARLSAVATVRLSAVAA
ncbi:hypothetical protein KSS87_008697 [Heliosperma pusillum]|nr:hypothetical protein KSS87_008697 [Heliosperma pusillum]